MRLTRLLMFAACATAAAGCGLLGATVDPRDDAHVVTITALDCGYVVVKTQGGGFGVVTRVDGPPLGRGDVLAGALQTGQIRLDLLPFPEQEIDETVTLNVIAANRSIEAATAIWRDACRAVPRP